jgi:hypothetical protein
VPCGSPVTTHLDLSSWICLSKRDFCSYDVAHILFMGGNVVEIAEDDIEVDSFSLEDVPPFGLRISLWG